MDRLPAETLAEVASQLKALLEKDSVSGKARLASYSTINRAWQEAIERETFHHINIDTERITEFRVILSSATAGQRIRLIRILGVCVLYNHMPPPRLTQQGQWGEQRRLRDGSFSDSLRMLFGLVKKWEESLAGSVMVGRCQLRLSLSTRFRQNTRFTAPPPPPQSHIGALSGFGGGFIIGPLPGVANDAQNEPAVNLLGQTDVQYIGEQELPDLNLVSSVTLPEGHGIHPESLIQILSRMKCLIEFEGTIFGEDKSLDLTREYRKVLGRCLHLLPRSLERLRLRFHSAAPRTSHSVLVGPQRDDLCIGLRTLSGHLRKLTLSELRISSAIFVGDRDSIYPDWSNLEEVSITYPPLSSSGQWFAHAAPRDEEVQDDPHDTDGPHSSIPDIKLLNELYTAAGEAKQHMPSLKYLELKLDLDLGEHTFIYNFDKAQQRYILALESSVGFDISSEVAGAWGFDREAVNSFKEGDVNVIEVLL